MNRYVWIAKNSTVLNNQLVFGKSQEWCCYAILGETWNSKIAQNYYFLSFLTY